MKHLNKNKNNSKVTIAATTFLSLATTIVLLVAGVGTPLAATLLPSAEATTLDPIALRKSEPRAPMAASEDGNNVYIVWWTNRSGNWEVMFRASNDGGQAFGDRINLSNTPDTQSQTAEILAVGNSVFVTWWESSLETGSSESVLRVSNDAGQTFGPVINLGTNGTITTTGGGGGGGNSTGAATTTG
jgi:hypothetical protein